jgi:hypothetical protein
MTNALKVLLQMQSVFLQLESSLHKSQENLTLLRGAELKYEALCAEYFKTRSQVRDSTDVFCIKFFRKS